ncbi:flagellar biosynthesis protein FlhF [Neptunomonas sp.]|uniref:flagellar biosynthesis protein FlhF n=1 Tax=Neptunomonas sp. TaxID=1971898 RepID=UPI003568E161
MKVKRIFAPDMRQAMRRAREEIGPDAVIVSNHRVAGGVEVVAAHEHEFEAAQAEFKREYEKKKRKEDQVRVLTADRTRQALDDELKQARMRIAEASEQAVKETPYHAEGKRNLQIEQDDEDDLQSILASLKTRQEARKADFLDDEDPLAAAENKQDVSSQDHLAIESMQQEIQQLKALLEQQMQTPSRKIWVEEAPQRKQAAPVGVEGKLIKRFERMGLNDTLIAQLIRGLESDLDIAKAWRITLSKLTDAVPVMSEDYIDRGGMIAFVGPTGVGKTTSIGKLAARYVLRHGSAGLALVTTDTYRIAAHEQLKTFGRILDVPVRVVDENNTLDDVLLSLRGKRLVLIDTAGMSQHEGPSGAQKEMLSGVSVRLKKLLVLSCSSQRQVLEDAYDNYQSIGLNGCVLSKLDESGSLGEALALVVEKALPIAYVTDGQKVPDDIEVAQRNDLVSRAVITAQKTLERERTRALSATGGTSALSSAG